MSRFYSPEGLPMEMREWSALFDKRSAFFEKPREDDSWWRGRTQVGDAEISTVWLGLDYSFGGDPPLFWETMIFGGEHDEECWRYSSKEAALAHHDLIVAALKGGEEIPDA